MQAMSQPIRYLSDAEAPRYLPDLDARVDLCEQALIALAQPPGAGGSRPADLPPKMPIDVARGAAFAHAMPAAVEIGGQRHVGLKWIAGDPAAPPPSIQGVILLERVGAPGLRAIVAAAGLTGARTAAVSMVGLRAAPPRTQHVADGGVVRVAFVGGGVQAHAHREALHAEMPDARVCFVTRRAPGELPLGPHDAAVSPEVLAEAVRNADVVITSVAFGTEGRAIDPRDVVPGATLIATDYATAVTAATVTGIRAHGAEAEPVPRLLVDDATQFDATRSSGKLPGYAEADATLGALLADPDVIGARVRERAVGVTVVVNHLGVAVCDIVIASKVVEIAESSHAGTGLER